MVRDESCHQLDGPANLFHSCQLYNELTKQKVRIALTTYPEKHELVALLFPKQIAFEKYKTILPISSYAII